MSYNISSQTGNTSTDIHKTEKYLGGCGKRKKRKNEGTDKRKDPRHHKDAWAWFIDRSLCNQIYLFVSSGYIWLLCFCSTVTILGCLIFLGVMLSVWFSLCWLIHLLLFCMTVSVWLWGFISIYVHTTYNILSCINT